MLIKLVRAVCLVLCFSLHMIGFSGFPVVMNTSQASFSKVSVHQNLRQKFGGYTQKRLCKKRLFSAKREEFVWIHVTEKRSSLPKSPVHTWKLHQFQVKHTQKSAADIIMSWRHETRQLHKHSRQKQRHIMS